MCIKERGCRYHWLGHLAPRERPALEGKASPRDLCRSLALETLGSSDIDLESDICHLAWARRVYGDPSIEATIQRSLGVLLYRMGFVLDPIKFLRSLISLVSCNIAGWSKEPGQVKT